MNDEWRSEFMFGLLDYQTWRVFRNEVEMLLVTVNATDRTTTITMVVDNGTLQGVPHPGRWREWLSWLENHEGPRVAS